ncbi:phosphoribosylformimino-5-aminoimidazole carboxamide ribotide isomerase [Lineolata rhizophorae]|uniref:1-(5-phosphoribosyl)-5-[(5-phosphoribosylamino)methylideneamino] imidazole-4-carboxamide isomerase n=1 Tax=Lineolata rhizophorae TaxID=578093 RepID=A0A6A6NZL4_9PEZI|nr:phosphoribosylformimino-5-aminoimidazole carboxamide ribotide isomerase [Lineolata rhizophorae]
MTRFRPCIDLHAGSVKQIVGGTLSIDNASLKTNYVSEHPAGYFAQLYREHNLKGAHVIMLGPENEEAAREALAAWPNGMQVGGGIRADNAAEWIKAGAEKVIVTSYLFPKNEATAKPVFSMPRLRDVLKALDDDTSKLVIDLSCRRRGDKWFIATNKWQDITDMEVNQETLDLLAPHCAEFLVHAADAEGLQRGIDAELVRSLGRWARRPVTYAGGARRLADLGRVRDLSAGRVDLTIGSALDVFGGEGVTLAECVRWNEDEEREELGVRAGEN